MKTRLFVVIGTRPEAIKLAPLVLAARSSGMVDVVVCNTGQHREMTSQVLKLFEISPDVELDVMQPGQTLSMVTTAVLSRLGPEIERHAPDWVVVQGDTTTAFASALAAFYQRVSVAHVEAGLRTGDIYSPWPEEMNRRLVSEIASLHFPPTTPASENLRHEGIPTDRIFVTGNTGIDALKILSARLADDNALRQEAQTSLQAAGVPLTGRPIVLITGHRRESFGAGFDSICGAIARLAAQFPQCDFVYPVHPNPRVRETVYSKLGAIPTGNVHLVDPLEYLPFVRLMSLATLILTDSGGVQEEAPSLGKRVIVLREKTERAEGLETGLVRLVGTDPDKIVSNAAQAIAGVWSEPHAGVDVYGDGLASRRVLAHIMDFHK